MSDEKPDHEAGEGGDVNGEYKRPDAAKAFDIYDKQIAPKLAKMATLKGDLSQPYDDIKEHANFPRAVLNFIVKLEDLEEAKRDHFLLALAAGLDHRGLRLPRDLVTMAQGEDGDSIVQTGEARARPHLVKTGDGEEFTEASDAELAKQRDRQSNVDAQAKAEEEAEAAELAKKASASRSAKAPAEAGATAH